MYSVEIVSGKRFTAINGESLLEAAGRGDINLSYSCKIGRCSTCKCKVLSGITRVIRPESGLTEQEKADGWILSCVRAAETDILLEVDELGDIELPVAKTWPCRISDIKMLAPDVVQVLLRLPPTAEFRFIPGQYIDVIGPNGIRRSYSLANTSFVDKALELHIRAVHGGAMSDYWFNKARPNDLLRLYGPLGTFFLRETAGIDLIFVATGTGIGPVKAMLESLVNLPNDQRPKTVSVFWGGRLSQDLYLDLANTPGSHEYFPVLSCAEDGWIGARGYVQDVLLELKPDLTNAVVYACGSEAMILSARARLVESGLPAKRFYSDPFVSSGPG